MPIFEYQCKKCKKNFEKLVKKSDEKVSCPDCGDKEPQKLISAFSSSSSTADCPSGGPCDQPTSRHCCGGSCGCGGH